MQYISRYRILFTIRYITYVEYNLTSDIIHIILAV